MTIPKPLIMVQTKNQKTQTVIPITQTVVKAIQMIIPLTLTIILMMEPILKVMAIPTIMLKLQTI